jgi:hypothetical protein
VIPRKDFGARPGEGEKKLWLFTTLEMEEEDYEFGMGETRPAEEE